MLLRAFTFLLGAFETLLPRRLGLVHICVISFHVLVLDSLVDVPSEAVFVIERSTEHDGVITRV